MQHCNDGGVRHVLAGRVDLSLVSLSNLVDPGRTGPLPISDYELGSCAHPSPTERQASSVQFMLYNKMHVDLGQIPGLCLFRDINKKDILSKSVL